MMAEHYNTLQKEYLHWLKILGFSDATQGICKNAIQLFFEWLKEQNLNHITQLESHHIKAYFDYLQQRKNRRRAGGLSHSYLNKQFDGVDKFLQFLHQNNYPKTLPPTNYRIKKSKVEKVYLIEPFTQNEIKSLIAQIPQSCNHLDQRRKERKHYELNLLFTLYYGCGLRRSEGQKVEINDLDFDNRTLFVQQGKGYKDRFIPLSENLYNTLKNYIYNYRHFKKEKHNRLFTVSEEGLVYWLKDLQKNSNSKAIKNKRLSLHILRHTIATHLLQNGMSVENIALFLGHSSLRSTQIYTHMMEQL